MVNYSATYSGDLRSLDDCSLFALLISRMNITTLSSTFLSYPDLLIAHPIITPILYPTFGSTFRHCARKRHRPLGSDRTPILDRPSQVQPGHSVLSFRHHQTLSRGHCITTIAYPRCLWLRTHYFYASHYQRLSPTSVYSPHRLAVLSFLRILFYVQSIMFY